MHTRKVVYSLWDDFGRTDDIWMLFWLSAYVKCMWAKCIHYFWRLFNIIFGFCFILKWSIRSIIPVPFFFILIIPNQISTCLKAPLIWSQISFSFHQMLILIFPNFVSTLFILNQVNKLKYRTLAGMFICQYMQITKINCNTKKLKAFYLNLNKEQRKKANEWADNRMSRGEEQGKYTKCVNIKIWGIIKTAIVRWRG